MKKNLSILIILLLIFIPLTRGQAYNSATAQSYLLTNSGNPWSTMALAALHANNIPDAHLKNITGTSAIDYAAPILAISALNQNPRTFGSSDYVAALKSYEKGGQIGDPTLLNDDIFGILALVAAGEPTSDQIISHAKGFILNNQSQDSGWGFGVGFGSDTNTTAATILALLGAGLPNSDPAIQNALNYLKLSQNDDGGFPYDPQSSYGTASDSPSTAWVIWALQALNLNPASLSRSGGHPISYLESTQSPFGYFAYQVGSAEDSFSAVTTAYAVIALTNQTLPIRTSASSQPPTFPFLIQGSSGVICNGEVAGPTAMDIVINASSWCNFTYVIQNTGYGPYLSQINSDAASGITGWLYLVNNSPPSIGAATYQLVNGDSIVWYYGTSSPTPPNDEVGLTVNLTAGQVGGVVTTTPSTTVAFIVTPSNLDFGNVAAGTSANQTLTLTNSGNTALYLEGVVSGDQVFIQNLKIANTPWPNFQTTLASGSNQSSSLSLSVPSNYTGSGQKTGRLTFWATVQ